MATTEVVFSLETLGREHAPAPVEDLNLDVVDERRVDECVFRTKPDTDSGGIRTPVPIETGQ